jgi:hypothetical protein
MRSPRMVPQSAHTWMGQLDRPSPRIDGGSLTRSPFEYSSMMFGGSWRQLGQRWRTLRFGATGCPYLGCAYDERSSGSGRVITEDEDCRITGTRRKHVQHAMVAQGGIFLPTTGALGPATPTPIIANRAFACVVFLTKASTRPPAYEALVNDDLLSSRSPSRRANRVERFQSRMTMTGRVVSVMGQRLRPSHHVVHVSLDVLACRCRCATHPPLSARVRALFRPHHGDIP